MNSVTAKGLNMKYFVSYKYDYYEGNRSIDFSSTIITIEEPLENEDEFYAIHRELCRQKASTEGLVIIWWKMLKS